MKRSQIVFISVIGIGLIINVGLAGCGTFTSALGGGQTGSSTAKEIEAYNRGEDDGYKKGYADGGAAKEAGIPAVQKESYDQGKKDGYTEGYTVGNRDGDIAGYKRGYGEGFDVGRLSSVPNSFILRNAPQVEINAFLADDPTSTHQYVTGIYDSHYFARDLVNSAQAHGYNAAYVTLIFTDYTDYNIVAFKTSDGNIVYYEPRSDAQVSPTINGVWDDKLLSYTKRIKDIIVAW